MEVEAREVQNFNFQNHNCRTKFFGLGFSEIDQLKNTAILQNLREKIFFLSKVVLDGLFALAKKISRVLKK